MTSNLDRYKNDLEKLSNQGEKLKFIMKVECFPEEMKGLYKEENGDEFEKIIEDLPKFSESYQAWYSEAKVLIKQLLPDRLEDFVRFYQKPKPRKEITLENYRIEDYLQGLTMTRRSGYLKETIVDTSAAIPHFLQQLAILQAASSRFESALFDIKQLVQADLFDSELDSARELAKKGFLRSAGVIAGVVLEQHLGEVCKNHNLKTQKKRPSISDFNDLLKSGSVVDIPTWRHIQRLGDLRNLCAHSKDREPTKDEIEELISGVARYTHSLF